MLRRTLFLWLLLCAPVTLRAADPQVVYLWPAGHPTLQGANEKEITNPPDPKPGQIVRQFKNIHNPSIEFFRAPAGKNTGAALIVAAGGGHRELNTGTEGYDLIDWLHGLGVNVIILKYRLAQTPNYKYTVEGEALQDTQRAIRIVRQRAREWNINPSRVGLLGFSAGGALAALADIRFDRGKAGAADPIDRQSCRPDFVGLVYAGWSPMDITAPPDAATAFLTSAGLDDAFHARQTVVFYNSLFKANVPVELHIYGHGGHANGIKPRDGIPFGTWHIRFQEWLADLGMIKPVTGTGLSFKGPIGLQLYSLREAFARDVPTTLARVRDLGIQNVELAGSYKLAPEEFKKQLDAKGLRPVSAHFGYDQFAKDPAAVAREAKALGVQYAGCAWIPHQDPFDEKTAREAAAVFNRAGAVLAQHGLKFFYHIHGYEFQPHGAGTLFDLLMAETKPEHVKYEMDVFWVVHPKQDPVKLLEKYGSRFELMHVKDMRRDTPTGLLTGKSDVTNDVALGAGILKWPEILKAAQAAGVKWYFIEDESPTSVEQIPISMRFLEQIRF
ncbi:MAG: TIM barrel protein [Acidobacteria bacterium]|nr:TIM barrel protein [Acidobacteriota bacterium]MBI3426649.1 TIM barrel protein [Acidobacteriota bacterium]